MTRRERRLSRRTSNMRRSRRPLSTAAVSVAVLSVIALITVTGLATLRSGAATPPSRPRSPVVVSGPAVGQIALSWRAPSSLGGSPITDYGVEISLNGGTSWGSTIWLGSTALTASSADHAAILCTQSGAANVTGLGCEYRVLARTSAGDGPPSAVVTAWVVPSAPRSVTATPDTTFNLVTLSWLRPAEDGGFSTILYHVEASMDGSPFLEVASGTDLGADVLCTGIVACEYRVTASNGQGTGAASAVRTVGTAPGPVRRIDARIQSSDLGTGVSGIGLTFDLPASGMPVDQVELRGARSPQGRRLGAEPTRTQTLAIGALARSSLHRCSRR